MEAKRKTETLDASEVEAGEVAVLVRRIAKLGCYSSRCLIHKTATEFCEPCAARRLLSGGQK